MLLRMLREFVGCGWVDRDVFVPIETQISTHMMELQRLTEEFLDDNSSSSAKAVEGLLFSRLAPLLVLRMVPRDVFGTSQPLSLLVRRLRSMIIAFKLLTFTLYCSVVAKTWIT
jgi:hypothetical protein